MKPILIQEIIALMDIKNEKGQTTVEYLLLLVVIVGIMSSVFTQLEGYMFDGPNSMQASFLRGFTNNMQGSNSEFQGSYKYFVIRK